MLKAKNPGTIPAIPKAGRFSFWEFSSTSHPHQHNPFRRAGQSPSLLEFASLKSPRVTPAAGKMRELGSGFGAWRSAALWLLGWAPKINIWTKIAKIPRKSCPRIPGMLSHSPQKNKNPAFLEILRLWYPRNGDFRDKIPWSGFCYDKIQPQPCFTLNPAWCCQISHGLRLQRIAWIKE